VKARVTPGLGRVGRAENVLFSFSAAPGQTASDGAGGNSEFSAALAKFLPTDGLEIRSVLTLVQQDVYDQSRGKQLPYVESGLPKLFFAASDGGQLPERDRLLLAMADVTPDLRAEVETIAAGSDMPLAPLYAALITTDGKAMQPTQRRQKLKEAADAFVKVRAEMRTLASDDPEVTRLRQQAEQQLSLGAFDTARTLLASAADIDSSSRQSLKENLIARTVSEATTHYLAGGAARADLRYQLAISDYEKAVALYDEIEGFDLADADRQQHMVVLELIGTLQRTVGNLTAAGGAFRRMEAVVQRQAERAPDNVEWQRDLALAKSFVADVLYDQGELDGALAKYLEAQGILQALVQKDADNVHWVEWVRDLAISLNRVGDIGRTRGNYEGALKAYRLALSLTEQLVDISPHEVLLRYDMAICYNKIGYAEWLANDLAAARDAFDVALQIDQGLLAKDPDNVDYLRHETVNLNWIGDIGRLTGKPADALAAYEKSRAITEKLMARDPQNTVYRRDLAINFGKIGDARLALGDLDGALKAHRSALAIAEYLTGLDTTNADWQRDLSISHNRVGDILLAKGDAAGAAAEYQAGLVAAQALLDAGPTNPQRMLDVAYSHYKLAMAGVDRLANLTFAHKLIAGLKADGLLPPAFESWLTMVDDALKATPSP
jgi:tetratricopeptide (TPR) repeat protein